MNLKDVYYNTLNTLGVPQHEIQAEWNYLVEAYVTDRQYHDINHIKKVVELLQPIEDKLSDPTLVRIAAFYHDIFYLPNDATNEKRSAMVFGLRLGKYLNVGQIMEVEDLILSTEFGTEPLSEDAKYLVDADIASGMIGTYDEFVTNSEKVIKEYKGIDNATVREGRAKFLKSILEKEKIFSTEYFTTFETQIKNNITEYIK